MFEITLIQILHSKNVTRLNDAVNTANSFHTISFVSDTQMLSVLCFQALMSAVELHVEHHTTGPVALNTLLQHTLHTCPVIDQD